ncbi:MAG: hypothetical protein U0794_07565 [Isosphaeraceae bacterium]
MSLGISISIVPVLNEATIGSPVAGSALTSRGAWSASARSKEEGSDRAHLPDGDQAIGWCVSVQGIGAWAIHVDDKSATGRTELVEVEPSIAGLERVERPGDAGDVLHACHVALGGFEAVADALVLKSGYHAGELRVEADAALGATQEGE